LCNGDANSDPIRVIETKWFNDGFYVKM